MQFDKFFKLYFKFIVYEVYNLFKIYDNIYRLKQFGLLNIIKNLLFKKPIIPRNNYVKDYLKKNLKKWEKINYPRREKKILITGFVHLPIDYIMNALIGKFLEEKYNTSSVCILDEGDYFGESIFRSFNIKNFIYLKKRNFFYRLIDFKNSIEIISRFKNIEQFLKLKSGNIFLGKIVYDHYLRHTGHCSTDTFNFKIYYLLSKSLGCDLRFKKILKQNKFKYGVQSEQQFIPGAISFQNCLGKNIKIFSRNKGPNLVTITKFFNKAEIFTPVDKIDYKYYMYFFKKYKKIASKIGAKIISNRIKGKDNFSQKSWGITSSTNKKISFHRLKKIYNWNDNKPVVCIFGHLFIDGNYSEGRRLHKDNLTWLKSTLEIIKNIKNVNWIVKPHPLEKEYLHTSTTTIEEVMPFEKKYKHIRFADNRISNFSLTKNIIATVSSHGTVSLEYASLGIPSVVCGQTKYTKLGFLREAKTINEYKKLLKNIYKIKRLTKYQIEKANVWIYLSGKLVLVDNEIIPSNIRNQDRLIAYSKKEFWLEAIKKIKKFNYQKSFFKKMFFEQLKNNRINIINYKYIEQDIKKNRSSLFF